LFRYIHLPLKAIKRWAALCISVTLLFCAGYTLRRVTAVDTTRTGTPLLVLMYHSILPNPGRIGRYVCSPETLQNDMEYLAANGYTAVSVAQVLDYQAGRGTLPPKAVMLTFDDGFYNNYVYVYPLLQKYNMKAIFCVVGKYCFEPPDDTMNAAYSSLTGEQMREMEASGRVEIANHSYDMHSHNNRNGVSKRAAESQEEYHQTLSQDLQKLQQRLTQEIGHAPVSFAYPFGAFTKTTDDVLRDNGFLVTFSCVEGINDLHPGDDLYRLKRYNRPGGRSTESFLGPIISRVGE